MYTQRSAQTPSRGAALLLFVVLFTVASLLLTFTISRGAYRAIVGYQNAYDSAQAYYGVDAAVEDAAYRHLTGKPYNNTESFTFANTALNTVRTATFDGYDINVTGNYDDRYRKEFLHLAFGNGASFSFGLQSDVGGIHMRNSSQVTGNIYSNGPILGDQNNMVLGDIISAGPTGSVDGVHATGSVYSEDIQSAEVDKNAYCNTIDDSLVHGSLYCNTVTATTPNPADGPGPSYQPTTTLPITDTKIGDWEAQATAGGVIASTSPQCAGGTWTINTSTTTGPVEIDCNVLIDKSSTVWSLAGPILIKGNLETKSGPTIQVDSSISGNSVQLIVDNPDDQLTSSEVSLAQSTTFTGSGSNSYILLVSQNKSEETGGSEIAIGAGQSLTGAVLLYASHGLIQINNSSGLKEVTGYRIRLINQTNITYESGMASLLFTGGPGGSFIINRWHESP